MGNCLNDPCATFNCCNAAKLFDLAGKGRRERVAGKGLQRFVTAEGRCGISLRKKGGKWGAISTEDAPQTHCNKSDRPRGINNFFYAFHMGFLYGQKVDAQAPQKCAQNEEES